MKSLHFVHPTGIKLQGDLTGEELYSTCATDLCIDPENVVLYKLRRTKPSDSSSVSGEYGVMVKGGNFTLHNEKRSLIKRI